MAEKRRAGVPGGRRHPHLVRVTAEEEAALLGLVVERGARNVPELLVQSTLYGAGGETPGERRAWARELLVVRRSLSGVANNINQIARGVHVGDGLPIVETREALRHLRVLAGPEGRIDAVLEGFAREGISV
jgi:hypothetical protein